jgi:hypothetical protein
MFSACGKNENFFLQQNANNNKNNLKSEHGFPESYIPSAIMSKIKSIGLESFLKNYRLKINEQVHYQADWSAKARVFCSFNYENKPYVLNYRKDNGQLSIDKITANGLQNSYKINWKSGERSFTTVYYNGLLYIASYYKNEGKLYLHKFSNGSLYYCSEFPNQSKDKSRTLHTVYTGEFAYVAMYNQKDYRIKMCIVGNTGESVVFLPSGSADKLSKKSYPLISSINSTRESNLVYYFKDRINLFEIPYKDINIGSVDMRADLDLNFESAGFYSSRSGDKLCNATLGDIPLIINYDCSSGYIRINSFDENTIIKNLYLKKISPKKREIVAISDGVSFDILYLLNFTPESGRVSIDRFSFEAVRR